MLNKENYVPWSSRLLRYAKSRPNGKLIHNSILNGPYVRRMIPEPGDANREVTVTETFHMQTDDELSKMELKQIEADDQAIQTIHIGLLEDIYAAEKKANLFNEWERFTSNEGESIESYYHCFIKLMNDLKRNKHFPEKIASNLKFLNNLQPEWSRHVTIIHQTKDLHTANYTQLYDFLKYNKKEVDELKAKRLAKTQDPLALMANSNNPYAFPAPHQDQSSFNQNYLQQPMPNPEDITDPTTVMNMALALMAKAFKLNYSTPTNNNQRISSNPRNRKIAQPGMNMGQDRQIQMVRGNGENQFRQYAGQNARNLTGYNDVQNIRNQNQIGNGNLVAARANGNVAGQNGNQIKCYNCRGEEAGIQLQEKEYDLMAAAADLDEIEEVNTNCILMANLQQASTSVLRLTVLPFMIQTDQLSVEQGEETVEQHPVNFEETRALYESLYHNLAIEVEKVNSVNRKLKETNADLTTKLARFKNQEMCFEISQEKYDKLERCYQQFVYQEQCLSKKINALHLSTDKLLDKQIQLEKKINELNNILLKTSQSIETIHMLSPKPDSFYHPEQKMALGYQNPFYLKQAQKKQQSLYDGKVLLEKHDPPVVHDSEETLQLAQEKAAKFIGDFKSLANEADASLAKHKTLELEIKCLLKAIVSQDIMNIVQKEFVVDTSDLQTELERTKERFENCIIKKENEYAKLWNDWYKKCDECKYDNISYDKAYKDMQQKIKRLQAQLGDLKELSYSRKVSDQKDNTHDTSANTKFVKQPIVENLPNVGETNALSKPINSNSVSTPQESKGVNNDKVIALGMFRINPDNTSREEKKVPNSVRASNRTKPITVSQLAVFIKKYVNSDLNGLSSTGVDNTKTRRPQPRSNTKNDRVPSASKSSRSKNKEAEVEEHHRNLLLSKNNKHISSACNNLKIDYQDVISKVNGKNSHGKKQQAKVSFKENQMKYQPKITKPKKVGTLERLATPKPRKPRFLLRWSSTGRLFVQEGKLVIQIYLWCIDSGCSKYMIGNLKLLINFVWKFMGTVRFGNDHVAVILGFGNDHVAAILGFGDLQWGNILITKVYFVEGLGHNLFSIGQFCDSDLEVAFRRNAFFVRNLEGVDLL
uniref:Integrase, catalytic region, zinc finger, CCHC-type, peptidase aspartic, catalytic n=1 Tax=Tanacetum cinerariifolium TaxID=118510 RepID=A0A6L2N856_TANCI|nr:integrase, catalytic region, zinc finger, CCHC-type, peptidase aspartic, catalytic [Tanacetum cinerariifolium]